MDMIEDLRKRMFEAVVEDGKYKGGKWQAFANKALRKEIEEAEIYDGEDFFEKIWLLLNSKTEIPKCYCGNKLKMKSISDGYINLYCSIKCSANCPEYKKRREEKCMERHGVKCHLSLESVKEKRKKTTFEKHGVEYLFQSEYFKEESKKTNLDKYGNETYAGSEIGKATIKEAFQEKYGGHPKTTPEVKQKCIDNMQAKHGVDNIYQAAHIKEQIRLDNLKNHGVEYCSQRPSTLELRRQKYIQNVLPLKIQQLADINIFPDNWELNDYVNGKSKLSFLHKTCGKTFLGVFDNGELPRCPRCSASRSIIEIKLADELEKYFENIDTNNRTIIYPKEIDIVINEQLGIEVNGVYWHSANRATTTLLDKTEMCRIPLIHFWEHELENKMDICISMVRAKLESFDDEIKHEDCLISEINEDDAKIFFEKYHINGFTKLLEDIKYFGLINDKEIVLLLSKDNNGKIIQIANKLNINIKGGLKYLIKEANIKSIVIDKRFSDGSEYLDLGFTEQKDIKPQYQWLRKNIIVSKKECNSKKKLKNILGEEYSEELSEKENMELNGWLKIEDCGYKYLVFE